METGFNNKLAFVSLPNKIIPLHSVQVVSGKCISISLSSVYSKSYFYFYFFFFFLSLFFISQKILNFACEPSLDSSPTVTEIYMGIFPGVCY